MSLKTFFKKTVILLSTILVMLCIPIYVLGEDNPSPAKILTEITCITPTDKSFGPFVKHELSITLRDINGNPLPGKNISWSTNSAYLSEKTTLTDQNGVSKNYLTLYHIDKSETYSTSLFLYFAGDDIYERSSNNITLKCYDVGPPATPTPVVPSSKITPGPEILENVHPIIGYVYQEIDIDSNKIPCSDFEVTILGTNNSTKTDDMGRFSITDVVYTAGTLRITKPGFISRDVQLENFIQKPRTPGGYLTRGNRVMLFAGDINQDNTINMSDIIQLARCFGSTKGNNLYNEICDFNRDQVINFSDVVIVAKNFNKTLSDYTKLSPNFDSSYYYLDYNYYPLKYITPNSVNIKFSINLVEGNNPIMPVFIEYWNSEDHKVLMSSSDLFFNKTDFIERTLTDLKPGITYWYRISSGITRSSIYQFTTGVDGFNYISSEGSQTYALKDDGSLWTCGALTNNKLEKQEQLSNIKAIASDGGYQVILKKDGTVWSMGRNNFGQYGNGSIVESDKPVPVEALHGVKAVSAGYGTTMALKEDGTVWAWGYNGSGQLGDGTKESKPTPVQVKGLTDIVSISVSPFMHSLALKSDGTVWAWGYGAHGQLGNGSYDNSSLPIQVAGLGGIIDVSAGNCTSFAVDKDGNVWRWGSPDTSKIPVKMKISGVKDTVSGGLHQLFLKEDGTVWGWGKNNKNQLGNGNDNFDVPVQISYLRDIIQIAAGSEHSLALKKDGTIWGWGNTEFGQLGNSYSDYNPPYPINVGANGLLSYHSMYP